MMRKQLCARKKLKALMRYIVREAKGSLTVHKLQLICYMSDMEYYRQNGKSLTGCVYRHQVEGPRPEGFRRILYGMIKRGEIILNASTVPPGGGPIQKEQS